jgi:hypothetical protein
MMHVTFPGAAAARPSPSRYVEDTDAHIHPEET